jgi:hypothetical protein
MVCSLHTTGDAKATVDARLLLVCNMLARGWSRPAATTDYHNDAAVKTEETETEEE